MQEFEIAFRQFLLVGERHHLPVCLVGAQNYFLHSAVVLLACQLFGISGYFVVGAYLAAHIEGLGQRQRPGIHIACVGAESIYERLSQSVERGGNVYIAQ